MRIDRARKSERGIASVEAALFLPIFLILILLLVNVVKVMRVKLQTVDQAREASWTQAYGMRTAGLGQLIGGASVSITGEPILSAAEYGSSTDNTDLIASMRAAGGTSGYSRSAQLTQVITDDCRGILVGNSSSVYVGPRKLPGFTYVISSQHGLVGNRIWERQMLPVGYDRYLRDRLNSRLLFTDFFPRAGNPTPTPRVGC